MCFVIVFTTLAVQPPTVASCPTSFDGRVQGEEEIEGIDGSKDRSELANARSMW